MDVHGLSMDHLSVVVTPDAEFGLHLYDESSETPTQSRTHTHARTHTYAHAYSTHTPHAHTPARANCEQAIEAESAPA